MKQLVKYLLLFVDYPFIFYWTLQTQSKDRLSHSGKAFATVVYVVVLQDIVTDIYVFINNEYDRIFINRTLGILVVYMLVRFYYKERIVSIAEESKKYPKMLQLFLKGYSILIVLYTFLPALLKYMGYWID